MIRLNKDFHFIEGKWTHIQTTEKDGKFTTYIDGKEIKKDHAFLKGYIAGCVCATIGFALILWIARFL